MTPLTDGLHGNSFFSHGKLHISAYTKLELTSQLFRTAHHSIP